MTLNPIVQAAIYAAVSFYDPLNPHIGGYHAHSIRSPVDSLSRLYGPRNIVGAEVTGMPLGITRKWPVGPWCYGLVWFKGVAHWAMCSKTDEARCQRADTCIVTDGFCG